MTHLTRRLLPALALALAVSGCVAYPYGYSDYNGRGGYGYSPDYYAPSVAITLPPGGNGYHHWN